MVQEKREDLEPESPPTVETPRPFNYMRAPIFEIGASDQVNSKLIHLLATREIREEGVKLQVPAPTLRSKRSGPSSTLANQHFSWLEAGLLIAFALILCAFLIRGKRGRIPTPCSIPEAKLLALNGPSDQQFFALNQQVIRIGRRRDVNDLVIPHETVSEAHAEIRFRNNIFCLRDLKSKNGTFVNNERLPDSSSIEIPLQHGDRIRFDVYEFEFLDQAQSESATRLFNT